MAVIARVAVVWAGLALAAGSPVAQEAPAFPDALAARCVAVGEGALRETRIPGISLAVRARDGATWAQGFGLADIENGVPVTVDTRFRTASIAKPMTAVVVMKLVEDGRLDLDADVADLLEEWPKKEWVTTPRLLLAHLGGVRHYKGRAEVRSNRHYTDVVDALAIFAGDPLIHEPGTKYRYTTFGFNLLGGVAQRRAGEPFPELLDKYVFEPAGMEATVTDDAHAVIRHRAQGYRLVDGELRNSWPVDTSNKIPGGGLLSTATDLVRFGSAMLEDRLVAAETRTAMWTRQALADGEPVQYGLGFAVQEVDGRPVVGHGGAQSRVRTLLRIWPEEGIVVAVMCNLEGARLGAIAGDLADVVRVGGR